MKGEEWKNAHVECWEIAAELEEMGICHARRFVGGLVKRHPVENVAKALRVSKDKKEPKSHTIAVLKGDLG